jgi:hypothetical protein
MAYQRPDETEDSWANLVPEQPGRRDRLPVLLAVGGVSVVLLILCLVASYILVQEFVLESDPPQIPALPTPPGSEAVVPGGEELTTIAPEDSAVTPTLLTVPNPPTPIVLPSPTTEVAPTATLPEPVVEPPPQTGSDIEIMMLPAAPVIDGLLDEWGSVPASQSSFIVYQVTGWDGSDDLTAVWRLAWNANNLYIAVEVTDDVHVQTQSGNQLFRGDSVDMQFDTNRPGDFGDGLSPDDFQITLSPGDFAALPPSAARFQGTPNGQILDAAGGHHLTMQARQVGQGYTIEAAIPWSDLNLVPARGLVIGLALNANDNDSPGTAVQEVMKSHVITRTLTDPTGWGTLTLR